MTAQCESGARERAALSPAPPHRSREGRGSRLPAPTPQPWPHARRLPCRRAPHSPSRRRCRGPLLGRRSERRQRRRARRTRLPMQGGRGAQCLGRSVLRGGDSRYGCPCHPVHRVDRRGRGGLTDLADRGGRPGRRRRLSTDVGSSPEGAGGVATSVGQGVPPAACARRCSHGRGQEGALCGCHRSQRTGPRCLSQPRPQRGRRRRSRPRPLTDLGTPRRRRGHAHRRYGLPCCHGTPSDKDTPRGSDMPHLPHSRGAWSSSSQSAAAAVAAAM